MKTYTKTHKSEKAADAHIAKIRARGGNAIKKSTLGKFEIKYWFEDKVVREKPKFKKGDIVAHTKFKTIGIVRIEDEYGETKTNADGNVYTRLLEHYDPEKHTKKKGYIISETTKKSAEFNKIYLPF